MNAYRNCSTKKRSTPYRLVRFACKTDEFHQTLVAEYKRNFINLLDGRIETQDEYVNSYTRCPGIGEMDTDTAENIVNRMASRAYELGKSRIN